MTPSTSTRSTFILLFYLIFPCMHASCPTKCPNGYNNKRDCECNSNCYRKSRMGILTCQYCTPVCSEAKNQVEVTPCTQESNRNCACKPGFYCKEGNNYSTYCHKPCVPCETGTFSSKPSLDPACKPHKDCAQLGMITLKEGTATRDRECVYATTKMAASSTASVIITTISSETIPTPRTEGNRQQRDADPKESQSSWLLLLILLLMLLFMTGFCMLMKGKALKTLSKCFGLIHGEHEEQQHWRQKAGDHHILSNSQSDTSTDHSMDSERPLGSDVGQVKGQSMGVAPQSSGVQQVTVKHNGKGENVSNTVGSIYIYSPGTVILGSNSGDKKEEAGVGDEALPLISAPQQESNPPSQEVRITMSAQEEAEEELSLSFPVPATGK
ncbi:tumor necrosis factor receptor superfamily member 1B isoform X3 [Pimephales promelas]|uniref:tumor necrosis factor receptor superfamily member 1B isoform X3 n=1 Tax=Pimephales promelas TaxID=90988 RepID=UPI00195559FE|nr:tumor necrosis factor receptor superfamily member 1B isoform X3 [Pimephales promelas]